MADLFDTIGAAPPDAEKITPLADRIRPKAMDQVIGQQHLIGEKGALTVMLASNALASIIFWLVGLKMTCVRTMS